MAINFFEPKCTTNTSEKVFGICDKQPATQPATLEFEDEDSWIARVENEHEKEITFTAIDKCLNIPEGKRCDAMIRCEDALIFIELKDRDGRGWAGEARDQLTNTIKLFKRDADLNGYPIRYGYIVNKQRPIFNSGGKILYEQFEKETGFVLRVSTVIKLK